MRMYFDGQEEEDDGVPSEVEMIEWLEAWADFSRRAR